MRIDVVTIFPEYLAPLDLSLIGQAFSTFGSTTCAASRTTGTGLWTTRRPAAARAW